MIENELEGGQGTGGGPAPRQATLREFFAILFRRKWIVIGLFAATTLTVAIVALVTPTIYISDGSVYVKRGERETLYNPIRRVYGNWEEDLGGEIEIVKSQPVLQGARAILAAEAHGDTIQLDPEQVDAEVKGKSTVIAIAYLDRDPHVARKVCDAIIRSYVEFRQKDFTLEYPRHFFESEIKTVEADLAYWLDQRRTFSNRNGVVEIKEQNRGMINQLSDLKRRRNEVESDLAEAVSTQKTLQRMQDDPDIDLTTVTSLFGNETMLIDLKRKIIDQESRLASLRERFREEAPEIENTKQTIATLQNMMKREMDARIAISAARVETHRARMDVMNRDIADLEDELGSMPDKESRMVMLDKRVDVLKSRLEELNQKSDEANVNEHTSASINVLLLKPAGPPKPANAHDYVRLALAPAFSIVVGIGLAFFIDGLDLTVRTAGHAEETLELPVLASLTDRRRKRTAHSAHPGQGI